MLHTLGNLCASFIKIESVFQEWRCSCFIAYSFISKEHKIEANLHSCKILTVSTEGDHRLKFHFSDTCDVTHWWCQASSTVFLYSMIYALCSSTVSLCGSVHLFFVLCLTISSIWPLTEQSLHVQWLHFTEASLFIQRCLWISGDGEIVKNLLRSAINFSIFLFV